MISEDKYFYKMSEEERVLMNKVSELTCTNYDMYQKFIPIDSLIVAVKDLMNEIDILQEKYEDLENDLENNYRPISYEEQV